MKVTKKTLITALKLMDCASTDVTRFQIQSVKLEKTDSGKTRIIATDGHKLAVRFIEDATYLAQDLFLPRLESLAPLKALVKELKKLPDSLQIALNSDGRHYRAEFGSTVLKFETEVSIPNYPKIDQVIPTGSAYLEVALNADYIMQLAEALQDNPKHKGLIFRIYDQASAVVVRAIADERSADIGVIMPMRTNIMDAWPKEVFRELRKIEKGASYTDDQATA